MKLKYVKKKKDYKKQEFYIIKEWIKNYIQDLQRKILMVNNQCQANLNMAQQ